MSLIDRDNPQTRAYLDGHRAAMERFDRARDPLDFYWRRGVRAVEDWRRREALDLSPLGH